MLEITVDWILYAAAAAAFALTFAIGRRVSQAKRHAQTLRVRAEADAVRVRAPVHPTPVQSEP